MQSYLETNTNFENYDDILYRTTFLSYFISLYISTIEHKNRNQSITVNEIYDFIQDLHTELDFEIPSLTKRDISFCFHILDRIGVCTCLKQ